MGRCRNEPVFGFRGRSVDFVQALGHALGVMPEEVLRHRVGEELAARLREPLRQALGVVAGELLRHRGSRHAAASVSGTIRGTMAPTLAADTILRTVAEHGRELRHLGVVRIGLFGSYLHGDPGPESDVDFLVAFERPSFDSYMETKFLLEDLFGLPVDLVTEEALKPALRHVRDEARYVTGV